MKWAGSTACLILTKSGIVRWSNFSLWRTFGCKIHNRMIIDYGQNAPSYCTVERWAAEFCRGRTSLEDDSRSGGPSDAVCEENCHAVKNIVIQNRRVDMHQTLTLWALRLALVSVKTILNEHLFLTKVCARWPPECLTSKWRIVDAKHWMKLWNSCSRTLICFCST